MSVLLPNDQDLCKVLCLNFRSIIRGFSTPSPFEVREPAKIFCIARQLLRLLVMSQLNPHIVSKVFCCGSGTDPAEEWEAAI